MVNMSSSEAISVPKKKDGISHSLHTIRKNWQLLVLMLPGLCYLIINNYLPIAGLSIAFKSVNFAKGIFDSDWAHPLFKNFQFLFKTSDAWVMTRNTILYNLAFIIIGTVISISFALLVNEITKKSFTKLYQTAMLLPYLMSYVIVSYLVYSFLSTQTGLINKSLLPLLHIAPISWYAQPKYWPFVLIFVNIWKTAGYSSIIYFASIVAIDTEYYESASLDGATKFQQIRLITLPLITPTIITLTLLSIGNLFHSDFGLFYQVPLNAGVLFPVTQTIDTYVYRGLLERGDIGMSSAAGFYQSIVGFVLIFVANLITRKISKENALF